MRQVNHLYSPCPPTPPPPHENIYVLASQPACDRPPAPKFVTQQGDLNAGRGRGGEWREKEKTLEIRSSVMRQFFVVVPPQFPPLQGIPDIAVYILHVQYEYTGGSQAVIWIRIRKWIRIRFDSWIKIYKSCSRIMKKISKLVAEILAFHQF